MSVAIISCGRSGSTMVWEILRGNSYFLQRESHKDDSTLCKSNKVYPHNYLTKCDVYYFTYKELKNTLINNTNMKVVWPLRDPRDMFLSKIRRGQPSAQGGDSSKLSADGTPETAFKNILNMRNYYEQTFNDFSDRLIPVKMEHIILDVNAECNRICVELGISFENNMLNFYKRYKNPHKIKRYSKGIDRSQLMMWKQWDKIYDGFFKDETYVLDYFDKLRSTVEFFDYDEDM